MGTALSSSTKSSVDDVPSEEKRSGLSPMQIAEIDYKAVTQSAEGRRYCKHPHEVWEYCMMSAKNPKSQCTNDAKDASTCQTILMIQLTMLACANEMDKCRRAKDNSTATDAALNTYQQEIQRRFMPCVKRHLNANNNNKQYPESVYPGGSKNAVQIAVRAMKKLDESQNDEILNVVGPLLRSDYDKATASFRNASSSGAKD